MPSLTEQERISIVEEAISVSAGRESGAFAVDNFLLAENEQGILIGGLCAFHDNEFPRTWEILFKRMDTILERRHGRQAREKCEQISKELNAGWYLLKDSDEFNIELIYVCPWSRGAGSPLSMLIDEACKIGKEKGFSNARISTIIENRRAKRAYEKRGFSEYFSFTFPSILAVSGVTGFSLLRKDL